MFETIPEFKKYIQFLSPKTQISEREFLVNLLNKSNLPGYRINKKFRMLKELHTLRKELINKYAL